MSRNGSRADGFARSGPGRPSQNPDVNQSPGSSTKVAIGTRKRRRLKRPSLYRVWMLNDDFTPMEFVVDVLVDVFQMDRALAEVTMLKVHFEGRAPLGLFPLEVAETKVALVLSRARANKHPLRCVLEPQEG